MHKGQGIYKKKIHTERCWVSLWTQRLKDYFTDTKSKSPTITHRFHSFNFTGSYGTLNGLDAEWTVTSLWPTDFTLSWIFLKVHKEEKKLLLTRFITLFRGFLAIAKFVECFARLMLPVWPLLSTKVICWPSIFPNYTLSELTFLCPWWTAWSEVREREKKSGPLGSSVRGISTCLSQLYGDSFHFSPCHLQTLRMKGSEWKFLALKLPLH